MRRAKTIVFAFRALGETRKAAALTDGANAVASSSQNLVRIGLMADVPNQLVIGCVEDVVKSDGQFDDTQTRAEMPAGQRNRADRLIAQFVCNLLEVPRIDTAQIRRTLDGVENCMWQRRIEDRTGSRHS